MAYQRYRRVNLTPLWVLIAVNFVILIATYINPGIIFRLFGLTPILFLRQPWTIVTSIFVHGGIGHLIANMITLFFFGRFLITLLGEKNFLITYFAGGILGGIFYLILGVPSVPAVGASGAVYAVAGALAMLRPNLRVLLYFIVPMPLWVVITVFFVVFSFIPGVAWQAHLGGLIVGLTAGYFFKRRERYFFF